MIKNLFISIACAACLVSGHTTANEAILAARELDEFSTVSTIERFRLYASHCASTAPGTRFGFERFMVTVTSRLQSISKELIDAPEYRDMKGKPVPQTLMEVMVRQFDAMQSKLRISESAQQCQERLEYYQSISDAELKENMSSVLAGIKALAETLASD